MKTWWWVPAYGPLRSWRVYRRLRHSVSHGKYREEFYSSLLLALSELLAAVILGLTYAYRYWW